MVGKTFIQSSLCKIVLIFQKVKICIAMDEGTVIISGFDDCKLRQFTIPFVRIIYHSFSTFPTRLVCDIPQLQMSQGLYRRTGHCQY
jgi:hypothetical protein